MATYSRNYDFSDSDPFDDAQFNEEFNDLTTFLNTEVSHLDGTNTFTGLPDLPGAPSQPSHMVTKGYVDDWVVGGTTNSILGPSADGTLATTGTVVDWPAGGAPLVVTHTKLFADTKIVIDHSFTHFAWSVNDANHYVNVNGTDHLTGQFFNNTPFDRRVTFGMTEVTGLAAGVITCTLRVELSGGGMLQTDLACQVAMQVLEVWA